jgi:pimeloyl-ACP methyl ester carboxylesterase
MKRAGRLLLAITFAATAVAGAVSPFYTKELGRARDAVSRGSVTVSLGTGPVEFAETGAGIPLLSIHGAGGGFDQGLANAAALGGEGFRIVAPSRFGYLRTPIPPDTSPAAQADAHAALLAKLNVPKAVTLGVSAGARSAAELALRHPDRVAALILIVPALYSPASPVSIEPSRGSKFAFWAVNAGGDFIWWATGKVSPSTLIRFLGVPPDIVAAAPQAERDRVMRIVQSVEPLSLRFRGIQIDNTPMHELPLEKISAPTLIVSARDDLFNTLPAAEFAASKIHGAKLVVYETGGHLLVGRGEEIRKEVQAFLSGAGLVPPSDSAAAVRN